MDETRLPDEGAIAYSERLAHAKAEAVYARNPSETRPIVAADTIVVIDGNILGKPTSETNAREMLEMLSGRVHQVVTAFCVRRGTESRTQAVSTEVTFRPLSPADVARYMASNEWTDKAGGYAIQGLAAGFVPRISGSYTNIVGLPMCEVLDALASYLNFH